MSLKYITILLGLDEQFVLNNLLICSLIGGQLILPILDFVVSHFNSNLMDIEHSSADILAKLQQISISSMAAVPQQRQANTLLAAHMQNQIHPGHIDQYNILYLDRLAKLAKRMPFSKICKIQDVDGHLGPLDIVGIFKRLEVKRVRAFEKNFDQYYSNIKKIYDERDTLELQDATGKIKFVLQPGATMNGKEVKATELPYGIIIGLTGIYDEQKMEFKTTKITLPNLAPQKPFIYQSYEKPRKTLMMSSPSIESFQRALLQICGLGNLNTYNTIKSIIVMGFCDKLTPKDYRRLDNILEKYGSSIDIFLMQSQKQGEIYPQKPIHPMLLNKSYKKVSLVSNPQIFYPNIDDQEPEDVDMSKLSGSILACSGQNIKDLIINCEYGENSLDTMQSILEYSHMAPTCPFSMKCEMTPEDYLIMHELPHVFVAANCEQTMLRDFRDSDGDRKVKLVALQTGDMILVDIDNHKIDKFMPLAPSNFL